MIELRIDGHEDVKARYTVRIGREPGWADVVLTHERISRHHLEIRLTEGGYRALDLGSHNGTELNGKRLEPNERVELKRFDIQDGLGLKMLEWAGLRVVLVSGRESPATTLRAEGRAPALSACRREEPAASTLSAVRSVAWAARIIGLPVPEVLYRIQEWPDSRWVAD